MKKRKVASNYSDAVDTKTLLSDWVIKGLDFLNNNQLFHQMGWKIPTGASNCTLSATQWVNPEIPISRADTIIKNGSKYGYYEIPEAHANKGDLVIATNPQNNAHHTMLIDGFVDRDQYHTFLGTNYFLPQDHPLVSYSTGTTQNTGYRNKIGLKEYLDNSHGKTDVKYYRHYNTPPTSVLLPELVVKYRK